MSNTVNIKSLPAVTEVKIGDYLILETTDGTRLIDFDDFVITEYNTTFYSVVSGNSLNIDTNTANIKSLSSTFTEGTLSVGTTAVSVSALGIGTHQPDGALLHINGTAPKIKFTDTDTGSDSFIDCDSSIGGVNIMADHGNEVAGSYINFYVDSTQQMVILDGKVGIGITDPTYTLDLSGAGSIENSRIKTSNTTGVVNFRIENGTQNFSLKLDGDDNHSLKLYDETNSAARLTIDSTGKIGIGVAPTTQLHIGTVSACATFEACVGTPSSPDASSQARIYVKGGKLVVQYNDSGTTRYKYLDLASTGVAWTHSTTAP